MHHLCLSGPPSPTPATSAVRAHLLLRDHELRPFALESACGGKIATKYPLCMLFDRGLVGVEALELDDLGRVGVFAHDADAWRCGARDGDLFC